MRGLGLLDTAFLAGVGSTDWARRVIANGGAKPSATTIAAMEVFRLGMISAGLDTKMHSLCVFVPDSLIAATTPLFVGIGSDPWTNNNFVTGDLTVEGLKGNGTNKSLNSGVQAKSGKAINSGTGNVGMTVVITETDSNGAGTNMGWQDGSTTQLLLIAGGVFGAAGQTYFTTYRPSGSDYLNFVDWNRSGYVSANSVSSTLSVYGASPLVAHALVGSQGGVTTHATASNDTIFVFSSNSAGTAGSWRAERMSFAAIHDGLSSSESATFSSLIFTLRAALGGGDGNAIQNWAQKVVTNGGAAVSAGTISALKTFYAGLDTDGILPKLVALNIFAPDNLTAARIPLVWRAGNEIWTNNNFVSGDLTTAGLAGNATTKSLATGIIPNLITWPAFTDTSAGLTALVSVNAGSATDSAIGSGESAANSQFALLPNAGTASNAVIRIWAFTGNDNLSAAKPSPGATWAGYLSGNRTASNAIALYAASQANAHSTLGSNASAKAGAKSNFNTYGMSASALNGVGTVGNWFDGTISVLAVHSGLTSTQSSNFYSRLHTLRTALGGGSP